MIQFLLIAIMSLTPVSFAEDIEIHKKEMFSIIEDLDKYDERMQELKKQKEETQDGPSLENIVSEIAEIQKKLLTLRKRKTALTTHLKTLHSQDDLIAVMPLMKSRENSKKPNIDSKKSTKQDGLDERLDRLLQQIQSQYMRTAKDREEFTKKTASSSATPVVIDVNTQAAAKKKEILQEDKDKYLKESIKTKMKIDVDTHQEKADESTAPEHEEKTPEAPAKEKGHH